MASDDAGVESITTGGRMRAYIRKDPGLFRRKVVEQGYPLGAYATYEAILCLGEEQPERGRFRTLKLLRLLLDEPVEGLTLRWGRWVDYLMRRGDLVRLSDGVIYIDGWDEWQEGDVTVPDRMRRLRDRRSRNADRNGGRNPDRNGDSDSVTTPTVAVPLYREDSIGSKAESGKPRALPPTPAKRGLRANGTNPRAVAAEEERRRSDAARAIHQRYLRGELNEAQEREARRAAGLPA